MGFPLQDGGRIGFAPHVQHWTRVVNLPAALPGQSRDVTTQAFFRPRLAGRVGVLHVSTMKKRPKRRGALPPPLPLMMAELTLASWETIARRTCMMVGGTCSSAEYRRMVLEKTHAAQRSAMALMSGSTHDLAAALAPWHGRATANARRLRRKK